MARTFAGTASTTPTAVTITGRPAYRIVVRNTSASGGEDLLVNVSAIHDGDYDAIPPGGQQAYNSPAGDVSGLSVKTAANTATYSGGVVNGRAG